MKEHHEDEGTIVLEIYPDQLSAIQARDTLKAGGIESFLLDENVVGLNPLGGIELKIFANDLEKARQILKNNQAT